jgi:hypothetical protein
MFQSSILLATLGLAINMLLWSVPALVAGSVVPHALFPDSTSTLSSLTGFAGTKPNLTDALIQLMAAEVDGLHVAGAALQQPTPADIGPASTTAGARILAATTEYVQAARDVLNNVPR